MRLLLDTHCWLWLQQEPRPFRDSLMQILADPANELLLSAASAWEIAIKHQLGKLHLPESPAVYVPDRMDRSGVRALAIDHRHALRVAELPSHHRDPFDRLLVAQGQVEGLSLVTSDRQLEPYDVEIIWA